MESLRCAPSGGHCLSSLTAFLKYHYRSLNRTLGDITYSDR